MIIQLLEAAQTLAQAGDFRLERRVLFFQFLDSCLGTAFGCHDSLVDDLVGGGSDLIGHPKSALRRLGDAEVRQACFKGLQSVFDAWVLAQH